MDFFMVPTLLAGRGRHHRRHLPTTNPGRNGAGSLDRDKIVGALQPGYEATLGMWLKVKQLRLSVAPDGEGQLLRRSLGRDGPDRSLDDLSPARQDDALGLAQRG